MTKKRKTLPKTVADTKAYRRKLADKGEVSGRIKSLSTKYLEARAKHMSGPAVKPKVRKIGYKSTRKKKK